MNARKLRLISAGFFGSSGGASSRTLASLVLGLGIACSANRASELTTATTTNANSSTGTGGTGGTTGTGIFQSSGSGGSGGTEACAKNVIEGTLEPTNILFVIDRSGSMNCNPPPLQ